jgi:Ca2+/Na+ antiporter
MDAPAELPGAAGLAPIEAVRRAAFESVARACAFAALAVFTFVVGLSFDFPLAMRCGGTLTLLMLAVLVFKAQSAGRRDYRHTEAWSLIDKANRPPAETAQWVVGTVLRDTYLRFAQLTAATSIAFWALATLSLLFV